MGCACPREAVTIQLTMVTFTVLFPIKMFRLQKQGKKTHREGKRIRSKGKRSRKTGIKPRELLPQMPQSCLAGFVDQLRGGLPGPCSPAGPLQPPKITGIGNLTISTLSVLAWARGASYSHSASALHQLL